jgi:hypothetical protein
LRGYGKDTVSFGLNTKGGQYARMADKFMDTALKPEDPHYTTKYAKKLGKMMTRN